MYKKTTKGWSKHLDFILMDMLCFYLSFFIANFIRHRTRNLFINEFYINFAIILAGLRGGTKIPVTASRIRAPQTGSASS